MVWLPAIRVEIVMLAQFIALSNPFGLNYLNNMDWILILSRQFKNCQPSADMNLLCKLYIDACRSSWKAAWTVPQFQCCQPIATIIPIYLSHCFRALSNNWEYIVCLVINTFATRLANCSIQNQAKFPFFLQLVIKYKFSRSSTFSNQTTIPHPRLVVLQRLPIYY